MSRRRGGAPELVTIYWRDIPAQVNAGSGRDKQQAMLSERFQHAIDRAAGVAGLTETDAYVQQWRRVARPIEGDPTTAADTEAERLEATYHRDRLEQLVAGGGEDQHSVAGGGEDQHSVAGGGEDQHSVAGGGEDQHDSPISEESP